MLQVFDFESKGVRCYGTWDNPIWIAQDICDCLGLNNNRQALARLDDDEKTLIPVKTNGGVQRLLGVNLAGLKKLICRSRKPNAIKLAKELGIEIFTSYKEQQAISVISAAFRHLPHVTQFFVAGFRIDLYFPSHRVAVECDEYAHKHIPREQEKHRQEVIQRILGCKFVRFNPDAKDFNVGIAINEIMQLVYEKDDGFK